LDGLYEALIGQLNQARETPTDEITQQLRDTKSKLFNFQTEFEDEGWSIAEQEILTKLGAAPLLGMNSVGRMNEIFEQNAADPGGAAQGLTELRTATNQLKTRVKNLISGLGDIAGIDHVKVTHFSPNDRAKVTRLPFY